LLDGADKVVLAGPPAFRSPASPVVTNGSAIAAREKGPGPVIHAQRPGWRIQTYLAVLVAVFTATAMGAALFVLWASESDARSSARAQAAFAADQAARDLNTGTAALQESVSAIAGTPGLDDLAADPSRCPLTYGGSDVFASGHYDIIGSGGAVLCSSRLLGGAAPGYQSAPWLSSALAGPILITPVNDSATGATSLLAASPTPSHRTFVAAFVDLAPIGTRLGASFGGPLSLEFLVVGNDNKTVVARSRNPGQWVGAKLTDSQFSTLTRETEHPDVDGTDRIYGHSAVPIAHWTVYAGAATTEVVASARLLFQKDLLIILVGFVVVSIAAFFVYRHTAPPLLELTAALRAIALRPDALPVNVRGPAEVTAIANEFNRLIAYVDMEMDERLEAETTVRHQAKRLRDLLKRQTNAAENERSRIAVEIHDDTVQVLAAASMRIERLKTSAVGDAQKRLIADVEEAIKTSAQRLRNLLFDLRPPALDDMHGLQTAIEESVAHLQTDTGIQFQVQRRVDRQIAIESKLALFRITQEALANVRKHSQARNVLVEIADTKDGVQITVSDDGIGFPTGVAPLPLPGHLGMAAMEERAIAAGGWWRADSRQAQGTKVAFWVPG